MEFEALLLGIEPLTALAVGVGAVVLAPVVSAVGTAVGDEKLVESFSASARDLTKKSLMLGFEAFENAQGVFAEAQESFRDIVADAKAEQVAKHAQAEQKQPQEVEIVSD
jgi:hypothetical protein